MAMGVVDRLEMIDIDHHQHKVIDVIPLKVADIDLQHPVQDGALGQSGQLIDVTDLFKQVLQLHLLGDIGEKSHREADPILVKVFDGRLVLQPDMALVTDLDLIDGLHRAALFHLLA